MNKKLLINIAVSAALLSLTTFFISTDRLVDLFRQTSIFPLLISFILIALGIALSSVRFHGMMGAFQMAAPLGSAHKINIFSQIVGLIALQSIGQMIFRSAYGGNFVKNAQRLAVLTVLEKLVAISMVMIFGICGAIYVAGHIEISGNSGLGISIILSAIILSAVCVYGGVLTPGQKRFVRKILGQLRRAGLPRASFISLIMHAMMLASYVVIAHSYLPDVSLIMTASVFSVVMLGAAIPISFAGWGIRELSAGFVFSFLGMDPSVGVLVAGIIGTISLLALAAHGVAVNFTKPIKQDSLQVGDQPSGEIHLERFIALFSSVAIALLIGFQVRIPTDSGALTVNFADPFAFLAAIVFLTIWYREYSHQALWRINGLVLSLFLFTIVIFYGWIYGYIRHGFISWAWYNRGVGEIVILAYLFAGSMAAAFFGRKVVSLVIRIIIISTLAILALYALTSAITDLNLIQGLQWNYFNFNGLVGNRNALAFILLLTLSASLAIREPILGRWRATAISLVFFFLVISGSRTGMITAGLITVVALYLRFLSFKILFQALAASALLVILYLVLAYLASVEVKGFDSAHFGIALTTTVDGMDIIPEDRIASYKLAVEMWLDNPLFGAGMGAFISQHMNSFYNLQLTIHNSGLWILTEMGLVGFTLFLSLPLVIFLHIRKGYGRGLPWDDCALLLLLISTVLFSQAHEILYQRALWFMLGLLAANKLNLRDTIFRRDKAPLSTPEAV